MSRGELRIYLGAAPGVGKTFAMLNEGRRRRERGTDVVVGYVETHNRPNTAAQVGDLEIMPRRRLEHRGTELEEMDLDAILARGPQVALVDELAHTNAPGSRHGKRWEDVQALLDAGIDVVTTVNIQHLESLNDVVEAITGIRQRETVPDRVVREADQVELVDLTPEALRRRMAHGNIYGPEKVDAALANYFRPGNLSALRELALLWLADKVDDTLQTYLDDHRIEATWETRERVVVAVTTAASAEALIRRAARMAQRGHGELFGVHVRTTDGLTEGLTEGLTGRGAEIVESHHRLLEDLGGQFHEVVGDDVAEALVSFARSVKATQLVLGSSHRSRWNELVSGSVVNKVIRLSGDIDVHVISSDAEGDGGRRGPLPPVAGRRTVTVSPRRQGAAWAATAVLLPLLTLLLSHTAVDLDLSAILLLYLLVVCLVAAIGGLQPAVGSALGATVAANYYFTEPRRTLRIDNAGQIVALAVFLAVAFLVSLLVGQAARLASTARRARAEAEALAAAAARLSGGEDPLGALLARIRSIFGQDLAVLSVRVGAEGWRVEAVDGTGPDPSGPAPGGATVGGVTVGGVALDGGTVVEVGDDLRLTLHPGGLDGDDRRVLDAFAAQLDDTLHRRRLEVTARELQSQQQADRFRTAILRAVSHDLRSPLASIKASATSLLQDDIAWTDHQRHEFAETIDQETDRLNRLIGNLLDMSRIEAGAVTPSTDPVHLDDVVTAALASLTLPLDRVSTEIHDDPVADADAALLERVVANLVANALLHSPDTVPVLVEAATVAGRAVVRVIDRGPGIAEEDRTRLFEPFQRLGDQKPGGVGLGLAVAHGFVAAMGGELTLDDTPGGGLTATVALPTVTLPTVTLPTVTLPTVTLPAADRTTHTGGGAA